MTCTEQDSYDQGAQPDWLVSTTRWEPIWCSERTGWHASIIGLSAIHPTNEKALMWLLYPPWSPGQGNAGELISPALPISTPRSLIERASLQMRPTLGAVRATLGELVYGSESNTLRRAQHLI